MPDIAQLVDGELDLRIRVVLLHRPFPFSYNMMPPVMQWGFEWEIEFFYFFYSKYRSLLFILRAREKKADLNATGSLSPAM